MLVVLIPASLVSYFSIWVIRSELMNQQFRQRERQRSRARMLDAELRGWLDSSPGGAISQAIMTFQIEDDRIHFPKFALTLTVGRMQSPFPVLDPDAKLNAQLPDSLKNIYPAIQELLNYPRVQAFLTNRPAGLNSGMQNYQHFHRVKIFVAVLPDRRNGYVLDEQRLIEHADHLLNELSALEGYRGKVLFQDSDEYRSLADETVSMSNFPSLRVAFLPQQASGGAFDLWTYSPAYFGFLAGIAALLGIVFLYRAVSREMAAAELKADFVAAVSHEFRTPLSSILALSERLEGGRVPAGDRLSEYHHRIRLEAHRLNLLVNKLLDFAHIEEGRAQFQMERSDLRLLVLDALRIFQDLDDGGRIQLQPSDPDQRLPVLVDKLAVSQCVQNLIENAMKYSPADSPVIVRCGTEDGYCFIEVIDEGVGIAASEQEKIFEKFYRGQNVRALNIPGTGIGLALTKKIIESHQGHIRLSSEPGQGSQFRLIFQRAED